MKRNPKGSPTWEAANELREEARVELAKRNLLEPGE